MEVSLFHIVGLAEEALLAVDGLRQIGESVDAPVSVLHSTTETLPGGADPSVDLSSPQKSPRVMSPARWLHA